MRMILFPLLVMTAMHFERAQPASVDLSAYCPYTEMQYRATCYSYAVVYTAMSMEYNMEHGLTDSAVINSHYFSPGVVASDHNSRLPLFQRSFYCGNYGTADISLGILQQDGTVMASDYDCNCKAYSAVKRGIPAGTNLYTITGYHHKDIGNRYSDSLVAWIRNAIIARHAVITAIYENERLAQLEDQVVLEDTVPDQVTLDAIQTLQTKGAGVANHVVCIVGYDDNYKGSGKGYFLVKNNFYGWGDGKGFAWVPYTYFLSLVESAYYIDGVILSNN